MKRDQKKSLLAETNQVLTTKLRELQVELVKARPERFVQDRTQVDVKRAYKVRKQIKMIKAEITHRGNQAESAQE